MIPDRILKRIDKQEDGCWIWTGSRTYRDKGGAWYYGVVYFERKQWRVHRLIYTLLVGPIPDGLVLDHLCEVTLCCNPAHVQAVPQSVNVGRGAAPTAVNGRKTHCKRGHEFTPENTAIVPRGRKCKKCDVILHQERYREKYGYPPEGKKIRVSPAYGQWGRDKTHCPRGHEYTEENTRLTKPYGGRACIACEKERYLMRKARGDFEKQKKPA